MGRWQPRLAPTGDSESKLTSDTIPPPQLSPRRASISVFSSLARVAIIQSQHCAKLPLFWTSSLALLHSPACVQTIDHWLNNFTAPVPCIDIPSPSSAVARPGDLGRQLKRLVPSRKGSQKMGVATPKWRGWKRCYFWRRNLSIAEK
jgi:hypothetical protein